MGVPTSETDDFLKEFYIPTYMLDPRADRDRNLHMPKCPVLVFINSKSGGQLGGDLLLTYRQLLSGDQVFDLGKEAPDTVLHRVYGNLERLKRDGDPLAAEIEKALRLIVAGGDGTASWLLGVVSDLKLAHPPPVATVPLGTGNNIPFAFGWGKNNPGIDLESVKRFLQQVQKAKEMKIDSWHIIMRMRIPKEGSCVPVPPLELPHSLHAFQRVSSSDPLNVEGYHTFRGGFWNYFSMGMDAQVSYAFHSERKLHPGKFKNQLVNQTMYLKLGCTQGWFCASLAQPASRDGHLIMKIPHVRALTTMYDIDCKERKNTLKHCGYDTEGRDRGDWGTFASCRNIAQLAKVKFMKMSGHWEDLHIPRSVRSFVCLNLPSFSGGLNPWGTPSAGKKKERDLTEPFVDDGLLEVVGFRDAWHGLVLLAPNGHGMRLAQAHRIRIEFHKGAAEHMYMRMDGEPWRQPLPRDDGTVVVEISHGGQVKMLATPSCRSKSMRDPSAPCSVGSSHHPIETSVPEAESEERRKFGAADTFRGPRTS